MNKNELTEWYVVLVSKAKAAHNVTIAGYEVGCVTRRPIMDIEQDKISIGTLVSPSDELLDMTEEELKQARDFESKNFGNALTAHDLPKGTTIRNHRPKARALLLIYLPSFSTSQPQKLLG